MLMGVLVVLLLATFLARAAHAGLEVFSPEFFFFLACGASSSVPFPPDSSARTFVPDSPYLTPSTSPAPAAFASSSDPTPASPLYAAARADNSAFSYHFAYPAQDASSFVVLRVHFFPFVLASLLPVDSLSSARFDVSVLDDYVLLSSFSPPTHGVVKEFFVPGGGHGDFTIKFTPENGCSAFVNAVELFPEPPELLWKNWVTPVSSSGLGSNDLALWQKKPLETVYRLNVGGPKMDKENDTLWRTWLPDGPFFHSPETQSMLNSTSGFIVFNTSAGYTNNVAPDVVYKTQRVANLATFLLANLRLNITWTFPAEPGSDYLVRLHFCDYEMISSNLGGIVLEVYVAQGLVAQDLKLTDLETQPGQAFYFDYAATAPSTGNFTVSIGMSAGSSRGGILNGLEIMKLTAGDMSSVGSRGRTKRIIVLMLSAVLSLALLATPFSHK